MIWSRHLVISSLASLLALSLTAQAGQASPDGSAGAKTSQTDRTAFDPSTPLASRITTAPDTVTKQIHTEAGSSPAVHQPTDAERAKVVSALQQLPPFALQAFKEHVRTISVLDGIRSNGVTMLETGSTATVFNVVVRASILNETTSEFLTRKERGAYTNTDSGETISVEAGSLPALLYVLLHESIHITDISNRHGQDVSPRLFAEGDQSGLVAGVWVNARTTVAAYRSPLLDNTWFRTGKPVSIDEAEATYKMLGRSPFVSLYGNSSWYDDLAELVTCYYLTQRLNQPYRIVLRRGDVTLYSLKPMESKLVQARFPVFLPLFG